MAPLSLQFTSNCIECKKRPINKLYLKIINSKYAKSHNGSHQTQTFDLKYIATKIVYFFTHTYSSWRSLGDQFIY